MELPSGLQKKITDFLVSLPNLHDSESQRALLYQSALDRRLQDQICIGKPPAQFIPLLVSALADYGKLENARWRTTYLSNWADILRKDGDIDTAIELLNQARMRAEKMNDHYGQAFCYFNLGSVYQQKADYLKAQGHYKKSLEFDILYKKP